MPNEQTENNGHLAKKRTVLNSIEPSKKTDNVNSNLDSNNIPLRNTSRNSFDMPNGPVMNDENMSIKKADIQQQCVTDKRTLADRNGLVNNAVFEPVSPISDEASKEEQVNTSGLYILK